jgi:pyruvate/2-oxoglutarate dehydrogenase complex dihydrolipoamide acyltransferase (E2) component
VSSSPTDGSSAAQLVQVTMPQMGVSVAEGTIVEWKKRVGDWVESDETICEISTDKVDTEIPSPASGRLVKILVEVNETVDVGTPLAELDTGARPGEPHVDEHPPQEKAEPKEEAPDRSHVVSPVVQRIAAEHGVDLSKVEGTGVGGRVKKKDVLAYIESHGDGAEKAEPAERPLHLESPYQAEAEKAAAEKPAPAEQPTPTREPEPVTGERREPMSIMRMRIAEHMLRSRQTAAHCTTFIEVDMSRVAQRRADLKESFAARGVPLTYLAFVARATVVALQEQPVLNASLDGEEIVYHDDVNLGIAVALEGGLIVPVIRRAQRLSLEGIAAEIADLSTRARSKQLSPDEVQGGTFTITNPGQFGTILATTIINQPQVAILDLEAIVKRPVVIEADGADSIAIRPTTNLCLSFDHRVLDGAEAARFLAQIKARLERLTDDG